MIFTAQSRLQSYQQVALVEQILFTEGQIIYVLRVSLFLCISFAPLECLASARSQSCLQGLPMLSLRGVCDDLCVDDALSVLLALYSVSLYLDSPANMEFNRKKGQRCAYSACF